MLGRLAVLLLVMLQAAMANAAPRKKVVVLAFPPGAAAAEGPVMGTLRPRCQLVSRQVLQRQLKKLHVQRPTADDLANAARKIGIDALIEATAERDARGPLILVTVLDAPSGEAVGTIELRPRGGALDGKSRRQLRTELPPLLELVRGAAGIEGALPPSAEVEMPAPPVIPGEAPEPEPTAPSGRTVRAVVGPAVFSRTLAFGAGPVQGYEGAVEIGISFAAAVRPVETERWGSLALDVAYAQVFGAQTRVPALAASIDSTDRRLGAGAAWLFALGALEVGPRAGFGLTTFSLAATAAQAAAFSTPDVAYSHVELGALAELGFAERFTAALAASYRLVLSSGQIADGGRGGTIAPGDDGSSWGLGASAALRCRLGRFFELELAGELARYATSFSPAATVRDASDLFLSAALRAGARF